MNNFRMVHSSDGDKNSGFDLDQTFEIGKRILDKLVKRETLCAFPGDD